MKHTKRKLLSLLLAGTMLFTLAPAPLALAVDNTLYVASTGDDVNDGSQSAPYATLDAAYAAVPDNGTITIMDNLSLEHSVTFAGDKTVNLTGAGGATITYTGESNINNEGDGLLAIQNGSVLITDITVQMPEEMAVNGRVLYVGPDGHATLGGGAVLRNGYLAYNGGGVLVDGGSFQMEFGSAVENCYVANNTDCYGGGVAVTNHGYFEMNGGEITGNSMHTTQDFVSCGGGVGVDGTSTFVLTSGKIKDNTVDTAGGGVYLQPGATMEVSGNIEISGNQANGVENNLYLPENGVQLMVSGTVSGNIGLTHAEADYGVIIGAANGYDIQTLDENSFTYDGGAFDIRLKDGHLVLYWYTVGVELDLVGLTSENTEEENTLQQDYDTVLQPMDGYLMPSDITVRVGGVVLDTADYSYDPESGAVHIPAALVAGNIKITAAGDAIRTITVATKNVTADVESIQVISKDTTVITLTAADRYDLPAESDITITGTCDHTYTDGVLTLTNVRSDLSVSINGAEVYHNIYFDPGEGACDTPSKQVAESSATYGALPVPFLEGYTFSGWYAGEVLVTADTANQLTGDLHLAARWTQKTDITYSVQHWIEYVDSGVNPGYKGGALTSMAHGGVTRKYYLYTADKNEDGIANGRLTLTNRVLTALTDGLTMDGFSASGANEYSVIVAPDGKSVFPLFYDRIKFTVAFDANGGSLGSSGVSTTIYYGGRYGVLPSATRTGYTLSGWFTEAHGGIQVQTGNYHYTAGDITLYAHWLPVGTTRYTVHHMVQNLDNNIVHDEKVPENYTLAKTDNLTGTADTTVDIYTVAMVGFVPSGENSYKVYIKADGSAVAYLYYDRLVTDISFDAQGGSAVTLVTRNYFGGTVSILPAAPTKTGYSFSGWFTSTAATARQVTIGTDINAINPDGLTALTLYAHWTPRTYGLTFETHGGILSGPKTVTYGKDVGELPTASLTGYIFAAWYDADGKLGKPEGNLVTADTVVSTDTIIKVKDGLEQPMTLYAWYNPMQIKLTFDPAPGKPLESDTLTATFDKPFSTAGTFPVGSREGYTLRAWHIGAVDGPVLNGKDICKLTADTTLYAEYAPNIYVVRFDVAGGDPLKQGTILVTYDSTYGTLPTPTRTGYTFDGWFDLEGRKVENDTPVTITDAQTLTAHWTAKSYTVNFNVNGGNALADGDKTRSVAYDAPYGKLPTPTRPGSFAFDGWFTAIDAGILVTAETVFKATSDMTLYAHWHSTAPSGGGGGGGSSKPAEYTLTFESNGGSKLVPITAVRNTSIKLADYKPVYQGHTFQGWFADKALTKTAGDTLTLTANTTLYAKWGEADNSLGASLNRKEHMAYIRGYDDGLVHPEASISRAEVAQIFYRLLTADAHIRWDTQSNSYTDVAKADWYNIPISTLNAMGVLKGKGDGKFDPQASVTRAEFATIAARFSSETYSGSDLFTDIAGCWARADINRAAMIGWVTGDGTGTFRPNDLMTRAEAVSLINRVLGRLPGSDKDIGFGMVVWPDNMDKKAWYYLAIQEATSNHNYTIKDDGIHEVWTSVKKY